MILHFLSSFGPLGLRTILIDSSKTFLRPWKAQKEQFWDLEKSKILDLYKKKTTNLLLLCWTLKVLDAPRVKYFLEASEDLIWANLIEDNWLQLSAQFLALLLGDRRLSFEFQGSNRRLIFSQIHLMQLLSLNCSQNECCNWWTWWIKSSDNVVVLLTLVPTSTTGQWGAWCLTWLENLWRMRPTKKLAKIQKRRQSMLDTDTSAIHLAFTFS